MQPRAALAALGVDGPHLALNAAVAAAAGHLRRLIDVQGLGPEDLEAMAARGDSALGAFLGAGRPALALEAGRRLYGPARHLLGRRLPDPAHSSYLRILAALGRTHPEHAAVLRRHLDWYADQLDAAFLALFGTRPPA